MEQRAVLIFLCALGLFQKALPALIETQQTVMAAVGEEAQLNCQLMQDKDVLQVTWQKLLPGEEKNMASNNKYFGHQVNADFMDKIEFKHVGLLSCSIVIMNVTEEDEGCYHCLFNTYPEGALTGTTCLRLCELHGPILHVRDSPEETVVSCSATGRPAPTVTLTVPHYNSTSVPNTNETVTVTTTAVLSPLHHNSMQVNCTAHIPSGPQMEASTIIPADKQSSDVDEKHFQKCRTLIMSSVVSSVFVACCFAAAITIMLRKRKNNNSVPEMNEMPQATISDIHQAQEPLVMQSDQIRQRTPPVKNQESENYNVPHSTIRRLWNPLD